MKLITLRRREMGLGYRYYVYSLIVKHPLSRSLCRVMLTQFSWPRLTLPVHDLFLGGNVSSDWVSQLWHALLLKGEEGRSFDNEMVDLCSSRQIALERIADSLDLDIWHVVSEYTSASLLRYWQEYHAQVRQREQRASMLTGETTRSPTAAPAPFTPRPHPAWASESMSVLVSASPSPPPTQAELDRLTEEAKRPQTRSASLEIDPKELS